MDELMMLLGGIASTAVLLGFLLLGLPLLLAACADLVVIALVTAAACRWL